MADNAGSSSGGHFAVPLPPPSPSHAAALSSSGSGHFAVPPPPRGGRPGVRVRTTQVRAPSQGGSPSPGRGSISNASPDLDDGTAQDVRALRKELDAERSLRVTAERKVELLEDKLRLLSNHAHASADALEMAKMAAEALGLGDVAGPRGSGRSAIKALGHCAQCAAREAEEKRGAASRLEAPASPSGHSHGAAQLGGDFRSPSARTATQPRPSSATPLRPSTATPLFARPATPGGTLAPGRERDGQGRMMASLSAKPSLGEAEEPAAGDALGAAAGRPRSAMAEYRASVGDYRKQILDMQRKYGQGAGAAGGEGGAQGASTEGETRGGSTETLVLEGDALPGDALGETTESLAVHDVGEQRDGS